MIKIMDGRATAAHVKENICSEIAYLQERIGLWPHLALVLVGENPASEAHIRFKELACEEVGIHSTVLRLEETLTEQALIQEIEQLNQCPDIHGISIQLPLPDHIDTQRIIRSIRPSKDVDGVHPYNLGRLTGGGTHLVPCVPMGIMALLDQYQIDLTGKHVVVLGTGESIGNPMAQLCLSRHATVTLCHAATPNVKEHLLQADILIVAIGQANFVKADMIKEGAVVIDAGLNYLEAGQLIGDVDFEQVKLKCSHITPVPGGVGPTTIVSLLSNTIKCAKQFF